MNDIISLNINTKSKLSKTAIQHLLIKNNFTLLNKNDQKEILSLKSTYNFYFFGGLLVNTIVYFVFFKYLLKNSKIKLMRNKLIKHSLDLSCILVLSSQIEYWNNYFFLNNFEKRIDYFKKKYRYIIKNSILLYENPFKENTVDSNQYMRYIHQLKAGNFYFMYLLIFRMIL